MHPKLVRRAAVVTCTNAHKHSPLPPAGNHLLTLRIIVSKLLHEWRGAPSIREHVLVRDIGCMAFVWVHADSLLHYVASPFHSFVTTRP